MSNPFINTTQSVNLKVNNVKPSVTGNIPLGINNIPNLQDQLVTAFFNIQNPNNNDGLVYNSTNSIFENQQVDHTTLSNIGTNTHSQIDTFINSKSQANGVASLDPYGKLNINQIPASIINNVFTCNTLADMNALTNIHTGDVAIVTADPITSNNNSYINNGTSWIEISMYVAPITIDTLKNVNITSVSNGNILIYNNASSKWINSNSLSDSLFYFQNNSDNTKQLQFSLSALTSGATITLSSPNISCNIVGDIATQTLTNKTLNDPTNTITCDNLHSATTTININSSAAPTVNQALIATSSTAATWQTVNHLNLSNIGTNTHAQIDTALSNINSTLSNFSISSPSNDQLLVYSTTNNNTWTPYTLTGATFNDTLKTITISSIPTTLSSDTDVLITSPSNNQVLQYNSTSGKWKNSTLSIPTALSSDTDVLLTSLTNGQYLVYNSSTSQWNNQTVTPTLASDTDVLLTSLTNGQYLVYNSSTSKWNNSTLSLNYALAGLTTDVNISSPSNNQYLVYNSASSKWVNTSLTLNYALAGLTTDVNISSPSNNQILQYNSSTSKWVNTTLSAGSTTLASDTDVSLSSLTNGNFLIYNSSTSKWNNSDSLPDNLFTIYNNSDNTKKLQLSLSGLTTGTTVTLTSPNVSCNIVGDIATQTLTNKTLTDPSNTITANNLRTSSGSVTVSSATAPNSGQILTATSNTNAIWSNNNANAYSLYCSGNTIDVSNAGTPSANQVLTASSSSTATWQSVTATSTSTNNLNTTGATVNINASAPPATGQILVATSATTATWQNIPLNSAATNIYSCNDANISNPTTNNVLVYGSCSSSNAKQLILTVSGLYIINMMANRVTYMIYNGAPYSGTSVFFCELITFNGTLYGFTNTALIYTSTDPNYKIWTPLTNNLSTIFSNLAYTISTSNRIGSYSWVINDGTYFYACGYTTLGSGYNVARSADSITWTGIGTQSNLYYVYGMFYIPSLTNKYYTTGSNSGNNVSYINASSDGVNFTQTNYSSYFYNTSAPCTQISYQNSIIFITQGYYGNNGTIYSTNNGSSWNKITMGANNYCTCICWSPTLSLYIGIDTYNGVLYSSPDLSTWTARISGYTTMMLGKCYWLNSSYFLLVNNDGNIYYSVDGINWSLVYSIGAKIVNVYTDQYLKAWCNTNLYLATTINDVQISNLQDGQSLKYSASLGKWINSN